MKTTRFFYLLFIACFLSITELVAQNNSKQPILISGTKYTYPLIEKWISAYSKVNPTVIIRIADKLDVNQTVDLNILAHQPALDELQPDKAIIYAGRYALLPVTNSKNPILAAVSKKGLNKKELDKLFFEVFDENDEPSEKSKFNATIYARENQASASTVLAQHFGHVASEIRGKKVIGDDIHLLSAIKKDSLGLIYNNLGYLYDVQTRQLKAEIALLPIDLKKEARLQLAGNLDDVLSLLENTKIETIPVEKIGFVFNKQDVKKDISDFLKWVLTDGQKYNREKGFLQLDKTLLAMQIDLLTEKYLAFK